MIKRSGINYVNTHGGFVSVLDFFTSVIQSRLLPTFDPNKFSRKEFNEMMLDFHRMEEARLIGELGVFVKTYKHLKQMPGLFFWMKDDVDAVFCPTFTHQERGTQGYGLLYT